MDAEERKMFVHQARASAPEGVSVVEDPTKEIPEGHPYALVEVLQDDEEGILYSIVATGDRDGILWAWEHAQDQHPRKDALRILDVEAAGRRSQPIEFH